MSMYNGHTWCLQRSEEGVGPSGPGVREHCKLLAMWVLGTNLTLTTEPPFQPLCWFFSDWYLV